MRRTIRHAVTFALSIAVVVLVAACGGDDSTSTAASSAGTSTGADNKPTLTLYNAQHEDLWRRWWRAFTDQTGIKVEVRNGSDLEMANQIVQEGDGSPADVFVTENSPAMTLVATTAASPRSTRRPSRRCPRQYRPADNDWVGFAARATVLAYNTDMLAEDELPASIMDLADPKWKGKSATRRRLAPTSRRSSARSSR